MTRKIDRIQCWLFGHGKTSMVLVNVGENPYQAERCKRCGELLVSYKVRE